MCLANSMADTCAYVPSIAVILHLQVMRSISSQEKYSGKNSYALRVSPGTDCAFMIAFCITIDELFND
jgi:uncharacterized protein YxjI